ncbi:MAG: sigma-70 family RNA polymerase sigma factor [Solirubrobacteraceae bacterium]
MSSEALVRLWREYREGGDIAARDRLVLSLAPIVKAIVYRKIREIPAHREVDDFISCGLEALIRCVDRYEPDRGATLEQFAWRRIHGAVLDELRRFDWAPRSLRRSERELNLAREQFTVLHGRLPTRFELSEILAIDECELTRLLDDIARSDVGSLNALVVGEDETASERMDVVASQDRACDPEHAAMRGRALASFRAAFDELPDRERTVAVLLHVDNLTLRQTGEIIGVSESRVCQIHARLKRGLRERLEAEEGLLFELA